MSFTPFQHLIAQLTLEAIADLGFALGGGQAIHAHGYGDRLSRDLDFYVPRFDQDLFDQAESATLAALRARGCTAEVGHSDTWLRQILVTDPATGEQVVLDLGQDYRQNRPKLEHSTIGAPPATTSTSTPYSAAHPGRRHACSPRSAITCDPRSPPQSSRQTRQPRANRTRKTTTPTG